MAPMESFTKVLSYNYLDMIMHFTKNFKISKRVVSWFYMAIAFRINGVFILQNVNIYLFIILADPEDWSLGICVF